MTKTTKNVTALIFIAIGIVVLFIWQERKEKSLLENQVTTWGIITAIEDCSGRSTNVCIKFSYLVDDEWVRGSDPKTASYPDYIRMGEPIIGATYEVIYDATNPSYSKIIISPKPISDEQRSRFSKLRLE